MGVEAEHLGEGEQSLMELTRRQADRAGSAGNLGNERPCVDADTHPVRARAPTPQGRPLRRRHIVEVLSPEEHRQEEKPERIEQKRDMHDSSRIARWRRHPFAVVIGFILLLLAAAGGYLYLEYAEHFETTDDAFIAARQFAIAPQSGRLPHGGAGHGQPARRGRRVIARIDDRDTASRSTGQGAGRRSEASVANIDAQTDVQQAQIEATGAGGAGAGGAGIRATAGDALQDLAKTGAGTSRTRSNRARSSASRRRR